MTDIIKKIIIGALFIFIIAFIIYIIPRFLNFMEGQTDILKISQATSQIFQIEQPHYTGSLTKPTYNIKIPEDIMVEMVKRQQEKIQAEEKERQRLEAEKAEAERKKQEQLKQEEQRKIEMSKINNSYKQSTSRSMEETRKNSNEYIAFTATGYCPCSKCCGKSTGKTASGTTATAGRTVAMPSKYAFGTKIEIKGMGTYTVEDRGGAINGNKIDIFFSTHQEALNFGRRTVYLKIL